MEKTGQFRWFKKTCTFNYAFLRFTPPTHTILAFNQALKEFYGEGGLEGKRVFVSIEMIKKLKTT